MIHVFIDESIHRKGGFIISGLVFSKKDPNDLILKSLQENGFKPDEEYKSGINYSKVPEMALVRNDLKRILSNYCQIGIVVLPSAYRVRIGYETLKGLRQFIAKNEINEDIKVFFDQAYFKNLANGERYIKDLKFKNCQIYLENDSKKVRGIQLSDLVAHTCSIMLLETLGLIHKKVKAGENSGYDPDLEIDLGFELWATIRYLFLHQPINKRIESSDDLNVNVLSYGLYISEFCDKELRKSVTKRFGTNYLGCIH